LQRVVACRKYLAMHCTVLQRVAACCSVLQCDLPILNDDTHVPEVATCCSALRCNVLQRVAM